MQYFLQQSCSFWFLWNGSRQLLAEGLHHVAGDVLRGWLHKQSCLQKLVFHLPQNPGCHPVKGQSQWRAGVHHWQDACCHLYRRKPSQDKLKSATAKVYHLKANQTNLIFGSSTALFLQRWKSKAMLLVFFLVWEPIFATACPFWRSLLSSVVLSKLKLCAKATEGYKIQPGGY